MHKLKKSRKRKRYVIVMYDLQQYESCNFNRNCIYPFQKKKRKGKLMLKGNEIPTETHRACYHIRDLTDIKELRIKINPHYK